MENTQTETTTETTAQAQTPVTEKAAVATATETQTPPKEQTTDSKEIARQAFKSREEKREKKASERLAEMEKQHQDLLSQLERFKAQKSEAHAAPSLLDDPDKWAQYTKDEAAKNAIEAVRREQAETQAANDYRRASEGAAEFLLTRSHLKEDKALVAEVSKIIEQEYGDVGAINPGAAAKLAYVDLCAAKGIVPDLPEFSGGGLDATKGKASAGTRLSAAGGGNRVFAKGEAEAYVMAAKKGSPEFKTRLSEIEEAKREGRIQD